jgi:hypothetical protein
MDFPVHLIGTVRGRLQRADESVPLFTPSARVTAVQSGRERPRRSPRGGSSSPTAARRACSPPRRARLRHRRRSRGGPRRRGAGGRSRHPPVVGDRRPVVHRLGGTTPPAAHVAAGLSPVQRRASAAATAVRQGAPPRRARSNLPRRGADPDPVLRTAVGRGVRWLASGPATVRRRESARAGRRRPARVVGPSLGEGRHGIPSHAVSRRLQANQRDLVSPGSTGHESLSGNETGRDFAVDVRSTLPHPVPASPRPALDAFKPPFSSPDLDS